MNLQDFDKRDKELIDTLWNVNNFDVRKHVIKKGINRYIMECK